MNFWIPPFQKARIIIVMPVKFLDSFIYKEHITGQAQIIHSLIINYKNTTTVLKLKKKCLSQ